MHTLCWYYNISSGGHHEKETDRLGHTQAHTYTRTLSVEEGGWGSMNNQMQFRFFPTRFAHTSSSPIAFGEDDDDFSSRTKTGTPKYEEHNPNSRKEG